MASNKFTIEEYGRYFVGIPVKENAEWVVAHFNLKGTREDLVSEREGIDEASRSDPSNLATMPGLTRLLDDLSECGLPLDVASGSPRNQVDMILRGLQIDGRFRAVVAGDDVLHPKPAPDVYLRVTEELGVAPTRCVAIEDSVTGVTAAKAAGLYAIAVPNRYTAHQDLANADAQTEGLDRVMTFIR